LDRDIADDRGTTAALCCAPAVARQLMVKIHQIYYLDQQRAFLDPAFIPYDNTENPRPQWAEYHVFRKEYASHPCPEGSHVGYVSWKFGAKARIPGQRFLDYVSANPGYDVYFINPFPIHLRLFKSVWEQGEYYHPGITRLSQAVLRRAGYAFDLAAMVNDESTLLYSNYWVGNRTFWDKYMKLAGDVEQVLEQGLTETERAFLLSAADRNAKLSHIAFILERLFSTLLLHDPGIKSRAYSYSYAELRGRYGPIRGTVTQLLPPRAQGAKRFFRLFLFVKDWVQNGPRWVWQRMVAGRAPGTGADRR
jgi:hypothetical protein